jgi:dihydroxyacetone kinase
VTDEGSTMQKFLNEPRDFVDEMLRGLVAAHPQLRQPAGDARVIVRADAPGDGRVGIVTGGGSGHLPVFLGYVGPGLCGAAAVGNVFSSPSVDTVLAASEAVNGGAGLLYLYGNYGGDVMNFDEAAEELEAGGVTVRTVLVADDVASAAPGERERRRGIAGLVFAYKVAGAAAEAGWPLDRVAEVAQRATDRTRSMGVGLAPCILPTTGVPTFELDDGEMEIGIGIHGERGIARVPLETADKIGRDLVARVVEELDAGPLALMVNSLGATSLEELYVTYASIHDELGRRGQAVARSYVGRYATSMEMAGLSVTALALDDELGQLLAAPAESPFFVETGTRDV